VRLPQGVGTTPRLGREYSATIVAYLPELEPLRRGDAATVPNRPDWDQYFLELVPVVGRRATCDRGRSGCVVVRDKQILCTGYVGAPPSFPHCDEVGHSFMQVIDDDGTQRLHCVRTIHAEQNAIVQAARRGVALQDATFYCYMEPCRTCALLIVGVGARRVVTLKRYHGGEQTRKIFASAGIELVVKDDEDAEYPDQVQSGSDREQRSPVEKSAVNQLDDPSKPNPEARVGSSQ
jgi:dCMP deaminase